MHVFSSDQFQTLIGWDANQAKFQRLLDIGAGDGETTSRMGFCVNEISVTEMSTPMKWSLQQRGFMYGSQTNPISKVLSILFY